MLVLVTVTPEFEPAERPLFDRELDPAVPLTNFVIEAGMVGVRVISGLALVKSIAVSATLLSDKSSALLKSEDTVATLDLVLLEILLATCERATPPLESCRLSKSAANSRLTAASSLEVALEAIAEVTDDEECCLL